MVAHDPHRPEGIATVNVAARLAQLASLAALPALALLLDTASDTANEAARNELNELEQRATKAMHSLPRDSEARQRFKRIVKNVQKLRGAPLSAQLEIKRLKGDTMSNPVGVKAAIADHKSKAVRAVAELREQINADLAALPDLVTDAAMPRLRDDSTRNAVNAQRTEARLERRLRGVGNDQDLADRLATIAGGRDRDLAAAAVAYAGDTLDDDSRKVVRSAAVKSSADNGDDDAKAVATAATDGVQTVSRWAQGEAIMAQGDAEQL